MKRTLGAVALCGALAHCGGASPEAAPATSTDGGALVDAAAEGSTGPSVASSADGAADAGPGCAADAAIDEACSGLHGVVGRDVYVDADRGSDTNAGTPDAPLRTLVAGLKAAALTHGAVLVAAGTYGALDALELSVESRIVGGFAHDYRGAPKREATVLLAGPTGLWITGKGGTLAHLTVTGSAPTSAGAYALRTSANALVLDDVLLRSGDGLNGKSATTGAAGSTGVDVIGPLSCGSVLQPSWTSGVGLGSPAPGGQATGDVAQKRPPEKGRDGNAGSDGGSAKGALSLSGGLLGVDQGHSGQSDATPGYGAPGGGDGFWNGRGFSGGFGGSGGCPGSGGAGASSGAPSVALLVLSGQVIVQRSRLETGLGGSGGDGGEGGPGGAGGKGGPPRFSDSGQSPTGSCPGPANDPMGLNCAAFGGVGGTGGAGGHGGGGAGGSTIGIASTATATVTVDPQTEFALGEPGLGGLGGARSHASNGKRVSSLQLP